MISSLPLDVMILKASVICFRLIMRAERIDKCASWMRTTILMSANL